MRLTTPKIFAHIAALFLLLVLCFLFFTPKKESETLEGLEAKAETDARVEKEINAKADSKTTATIPDNTEVIASLRIDGEEVILAPFSDGSFERQDVGPSSSIEIKLTFNDLMPGDTVQIMTADGGFIDNEQSSKALSLNDEREVSFNFMATANNGLNRVILHTPKSRKYLHFWVGEKLLPPIKR